MSTLKQFLKEKNKEELIDDLKQIQKSLDSSETKENKKDKTKKEKSQNKSGFLSSIGNKFKKKD